MSKLSKVKRIQLNCSIRQLKEYCETQQYCIDCVLSYTLANEAVCSLRTIPVSWKEIPEQKGEPTV